MRVLLFILVLVLTAAVVSLIGRFFFDFDVAPAYDPHNRVRGVGVWMVALLVAILYDLRVRRDEARLREAEEAKYRDDMNPSRSDQ